MESHEGEMEDGDLGKITENNVGDAIKAVAVEEVNDGVVQEELIVIDHSNETVGEEGIIADGQNEGVHGDP
uniref:Uncharacterized protein n=1 Tax=Cannabis sativa TaxID=3483 RepID=A0A803P0A6_CANSA